MSCCVFVSVGLVAAYSPVIISINSVDEKKTKKNIKNGNLNEEAEKTLTVKRVGRGYCLLPSKSTVPEPSVSISPMMPSRSSLDSLSSSAFRISFSVLERGRDQDQTGANKQKKKSKR